MPSIDGLPSKFGDGDRQGSIANKIALVTLAASSGPAPKRARECRD